MMKLSFIFMSCTIWISNSLSLRWPFLLCITDLYLCPLRALSIIIILLLFFQLELSDTNTSTTIPPCYTLNSSSTTLTNDNDPIRFTPRAPTTRRLFLSMMSFLRSIMKVKIRRIIWHSVIFGQSDVLGRLPRRYVMNMILWWWCWWWWVDVDDVGDGGGGGGGLWLVGFVDLSTCRRPPIERKHGWLVGWLQSEWKCAGAISVKPLASFFCGCYRCFSCPICMLHSTLRRLTQHLPLPL